MPADDAEPEPAGLTRKPVAEPDHHLDALAYGKPRDEEQLDGAVPVTFVRLRPESREVDGIGNDVQTPWFDAVVALEVAREDPARRDDPGDASSVAALDQRARCQKCGSGLGSDGAATPHRERALSAMPPQLAGCMDLWMDDHRRQPAVSTPQPWDLELRELVDQVVWLAHVLGTELCQQSLLGLRPSKKRCRRRRERLAAVPPLPVPTHALGEDAQSGAAVKAVAEGGVHRADVGVDIDSLIRKAEEDLRSRVRDASFERRLGP